MGVARKQGRTLTGYVEHWANPLENCEHLLSRDKYNCQSDPRTNCERLS